jgi:hypothetical protein
MAFHAPIFQQRRDLIGKPWWWRIGSRAWAGWKRNDRE